jgi:hypothetical protein
VRLRALVLSLPKSAKRPGCVVVMMVSVSVVGVGRRLFHFSDDPSIEEFVPRPVRVPSVRPAGQEWLNGPLVWAVDEERQATYLFPRDCPRILLWLTENTTEADRSRWWGNRQCRMIAHVEWAWLERIRTETLYRYALPASTFEPLEGEWMWVSRHPVPPVHTEACGNLLDALAAADVELRVMESLLALRGVWSTSLHASGIRLRNAQGWPST